MRKERIYIICPLNVPIHTLQAIATKARTKKNAEVTYYERGTVYSRENLEKADSVIIILPSATFKCSMKSLSDGSYKELFYSVENKKPIYLGYVSLSGPNIYEFNYSNPDCIQGIAGTTTKFFFDINIKEEPKAEISKYRFKTAQEFASEGRWSKPYGSSTYVPENWEDEGDMNHFLGQDISNEYNALVDNAIKERTEFCYKDWIFSEIDVVLKNPLPEMIDLRKKTATQEEINIVLQDNSGSTIYIKSPYISSAPAYKEEELLLLLL
jgi:hypothetical protein